MAVVAKLLMVERLFLHPVVRPYVLAPSILTLPTPTSGDLRTLSLLQKAQQSLGRPPSRARGLGFPLTHPHPPTALPELTCTITATDTESTANPRT